VASSSVKRAKHERQSTKLSNEVIEIFRFSEAWKKETARTTEQQVKDRKEKQTMFPERSAAHMDGAEPAATALVLANADQTAGTSEIQSLEHLVNFAYTSNCPRDTVLWPVLPLRL